jgi:hypothetical protein
MKPIVVAAIVVATAGAHAQGNFFGSSHVSFSPSVRGSILRWQPDEIGLLILWRGAERWYLGGGGGSSSRGSGAGDVYRTTLQYGSMGIEFVYDRSRRLARIRDVELPLPDGHNVLLVDGVDRTDGGLTARSLQADLAFTTVPGRGATRAFPSERDLAPILRRSPEIVAFLRCDAATNAGGIPGIAFGICNDLAAK